MNLFGRVCQGVSLRYLMSLNVIIFFVILIQEMFIYSEKQGNKSLQTNKGLIKYVQFIPWIWTCRNREQQNSHYYYKHMSVRYLRVGWAHSVHPFKNHCMWAHTHTQTHSHSLEQSCTWLESWRVPHQVKPANKMKPASRGHSNFSCFTFPCFLSAICCLLGSTRMIKNQCVIILSLIHIRVGAN